jgi:hypothetical protein
MYGPPVGRSSGRGLRWEEGGQRGAIRRGEDAMGRLFQVMGALVFIFLVAVYPNIGRLKEWFPTYVAMATSLVIVGVGMILRRLDRLEEGLNRERSEGKKG